MSNGTVPILAITLIFAAVLAVVCLVRISVLYRENQVLRARVGMQWLLIYSAACGVAEAAAYESIPLFWLIFSGFALWKKREMSGV